jgi:hypothetical protein
MQSCYRAMKAFYKLDKVTASITKQKPMQGCPERPATLRINLKVICGVQKRTLRQSLPAWDRNGNEYDACPAQTEV